MLVRQFANEANPEIHRRTTAEEIWNDTDGTVDIVVAGIGTGGTITGVGQVLKERKPEVQMVAVEPAESPILYGGAARPAQDPGHRRELRARRSSTRSIYDEVIDVDAETAVAMGPARGRARRACWSVISSGAALEAAIEVAQRPENAGKTDRGDHPVASASATSRTILYSDLMD